MCSRCRHLPGLLILLGLMPGPGAAATAPLPMLKPAAAARPVEVAAAATASEPADPMLQGEELILQVRLDQIVLADSLLALQIEQRLYLPVGELAAILEFPIELRADGRVAEGWFMQEDQAFKVDLAAAQATIAGVPMKLARGDGFAADGELYLRSDLLALWWPGDFTLDLPSLSLKLAAREPLPVQQRLAREQARGRIGGPAYDRPPLPRLPLPYQLLTVPVLDVNLASGARIAADRQPSYQHNWNATAAGDLLYLNGQLFVAGSQDDPLDLLRLTLGRRDPDGSLLGPLKATEFTLLDVVTPGRTLLARASTGRGAVLTNRPLALASEFDRITLQGDLAPGWEVELYRNDALLDFRTAGGDGRFLFEDVGLLIGANELRLVFYGPQGQQREEVRRVYVGPGAVKPGELHYRLAMTDDNRDLVDLADERARQTFGDEGLRVLAELDYGLVRDLSLSAALAHLPLAGAGASYLTTGLRGQLAGVLARGDLAVDERGGLAWLTGAQSRIGPVGFAVEHQQFERGFVSEDTGSGDQRLRSRSTARLETALARIDDLPPLSFSLQARLERQADQRQTIAALARIATVLKPLALTNEISYDGTRGRGPTQELWQGAFRVSGQVSRLAPLLLRAELDYELAPRLSLQAVDLAADLLVGEAGSIRFGVRQELTDDPARIWSLAYNHRLDQVILGLGADYSERGDAFIGVSLGFSMLRDPRSGWPVMLADRLAGSGAVAPVAFLDRDLDGRLGPKDEPIANAEFSRGSIEADAKTDDLGRAILTGLDPNRQEDLALREGSLEDPYWAAGSPGYGVVPRPGVIPVLPFPVVPTGEIDGTVYVRQGDATKPAANVALQLRSPLGEVAYQVRSAYDGFYLFEKVRPGRYRLQVDPAQLQRLALGAPASDVDITGEGEVLSGRDLTLEPVAALERPAETAD